MSFEELNVLQAIGGDADLAGTAFERAQHADRRRELAEQREAEERRARSAENAEVLALANRAAGDPLGQIQQARMDMADHEGKVADLEEQLRKARGRLESARSSVEFWQDRLLVVDESTSRSRTPDPLEMASARAADELRQHREGQMVVERARRALRARESVR